MEDKGHLGFHVPKGGGDRMAENLYVGSNRSSNDLWDVGYIRTFYRLVYEHDLSLGEDFGVVAIKLGELGFDLDSPIDIGLDGDILVYGQRG